MAELVSTPTLKLNVQIELDYHECAALDALSGYNIDEFLKTFYEKMGKHYLQPHEKGLRRLFKSVREQLPHIVERFEDANAVLQGTKDAYIKPKDA